MTLKLSADYLLDFYDLEIVPHRYTKISYTSYGGGLAQLFDSVLYGH